MEQELANPLRSSFLLNLVEDGGTGTGSFTSPLREAAITSQGKLVCSLAVRAISDPAGNLMRQCALDNWFDVSSCVCFYAASDVSKPFGRRRYEWSCPISVLMPQHLPLDFG